jgi:hypothetical protein
VYSIHGSVVERQLSFRGGACSSPGKNNMFKVGLPPSQDENWYLVTNLAGHLELVGHLEK